MRRPARNLVAAATVALLGVAGYAAAVGTETVATVTVTDPARVITTVVPKNTRTVRVTVAGVTHTVEVSVPTVTVTESATTTEPPVTTTEPPTTTTEPPPPPPPTGGFDVYVSPGGSDGNACSELAPCQSFARASAVAPNPGRILVRAGVYPSQNFAGGYLSAQGDVNKTLEFVGEPGNAVRRLHFGSGRFTFDGVNVDAGGAQLGGNDGATFENGGAPFTFRNGSIGGVVDQKGAMIDGPGMVFDNVRFHDVVLRTSGVHSECVFASVPDGMVVRNSTFTNCAVMDMFFVYPDWWVPLPAPYCCVTLEGNQFGAPVGTYSVYIAKIGTSIATSAPVTGWTVRNNWFGSAVNVDAPIGTGNTFCGNTGSSPNGWASPC